MIAIPEEVQAAPEVVGDRARQAVASLGGYAHQVFLAAMEWLDIPTDAELHLEVAEDFAVAARDSLRAVQVKIRTAPITLASRAAAAALDSFVGLTASNPARAVRLVFLTTAEIGVERKPANRPRGLPGLRYWAQVAAGGDPSELRRVLLGLDLAPSTKKFIEARSGDTLRRELVRRIEWICGSHPTAGVEAELRRRASQVCQDEFGLPGDEGRRLVPHLVLRVLRTSCLPDGRRLSRSDLKATVEEATRMSVPRRFLEAALGRAAETIDMAARLRDPSIPEGDMPMPGPLADRPDLLAGIVAALASGGLAIIHGGSGTGKTVLARLAARALGGEWRFLDLRRVPSEEAMARLIETARREGARPFVIADDTPDIDLGAVASQIGRASRMIAARSGQLIITSSRAPGPVACRTLGVDARAVFPTRVLTEEEIEALVHSAGGGGGWSAKIRTAARGGHPQLVNAIVRSLSSRGWPGAGGEPTVLTTSSEVADEEQAARRALASALTDTGARTLVYRLSGLEDPFPRAVALSVGTVSPETPLPGEAFDGVVGPWIDQVGRDRFRVSPLLLGSGEAVLPAPERLGVDRAIASALVDGRSLHPDQADNIFRHAKRGRMPEVLRGLAAAILKLGKRELRLHRRYMPELLAAAPGSQVFGSDPKTSLMLRFAQFELAASGAPDGVLANAARALFEESRSSPRRTVVAALGKILGHPALPASLPEWPHLLGSLAEACAEAAGELAALFPDAPKPAEFIPTLFGSALISLRDVASLASAFARLDRLAPETRNDILVPGTGVTAPQHLVARPWLREREAGLLDAPAAARSFGEMAELTSGWKQPEWAEGLYVARAQVLAEPQRDIGAALTAIEEAIAVLGERPRLLRCRAHLLFVRKDDASVHELVGRLGAGFADDPIERAYMLREGAISAARLAIHGQAADWFTEAAQTLEMIEWDGVRPMAIGLRMDAAAALWRLHKRPAALQEVSRAFDALDKLDPSSSPQAGYVHRVARHALLWFLDGAGERGVIVDGEPPHLPPGCVSNPDPPDPLTGRVIPHWR